MTAPETSHQSFFRTARLFSPEGRVLGEKFFPTQEERNAFAAENEGWKKRGKFCSSKLEKHLKGGSLL